jgi:YebC/PmpR family DNA-binding regulatory protein
MSGHSKWSTIKHKKAALDAKKGVIFTKLAREITVAAREGGPDPEINYRLRLTIDKARQNNMPHDNVERAIKKGTGTGGEASAFDEAVYEGYGPGGAAILIKALTDNRNRTASEVRAAFSRGGGNMGEAGSVAWIFENKAMVVVERVGQEKAEIIALAAIDAGADDFKVEVDTLEISGPPATLEAINVLVRNGGLESMNASVTMIPKTTIALDPSNAERTLRLLDRFEDLDDIQQVFTNADFPEEALDRYQSE